VPEPFRRLFPLLLALSLLLGACAPLASDNSDQDRERIAALQQKLQQLQEQLAAIETAPPQAERGWQPLLAGTLPTADQPCYSYLLYAGSESPAALKRLAALLDGVSAAPLPRPAPAAGLLMLVPLTTDAPRPTIENYDFVAARALLESTGLTPPTAAGPLLLTTRHPLTGSVQPAVLLVPGEAAGNELQSLLANYWLPVSSPDAPLAELCWNLLESAAPGTLAAVRQGRVVLLQRP
jgi:hypothetical protein